MIIFSANLQRFDIFDKRVHKLKDDNIKLITSTVGFIATANGKALSFYSSLLNIEPQTFLHDTEIIQILQLSPCSVAVIGEDFEIYEYFSMENAHEKLFNFKRTMRCWGFSNIEAKLSLFELGKMELFLTMP